MFSIGWLLFGNKILTISLVSWFIAQALKVIISIIQNGKLDYHRFIGAGGMPSSHSALAMSLATAIGIEHGWDSTLFALSLVVALIIMYDAASLRRAAGQQAEVLNKMLDELFHDGRIKEERLKELLGHTPLEVLAGALLGIGIAFWLQ